MNLPTREKCQEIVKNSDAFYCIERTVEGQKVELYDYRLASISDFTNNDAFELRGLTFVYDESNNEWQRNLLLNKFFNYSQAPGWMPEDLDNKKVIRVQEKLDGSIISFVRFKNNKIRAKSKMSFDSEQAVMAQEILDNDENLYRFVSDALDDNYVTIWELVSPNNQIVLQYPKTELRLLQIRDIHGIYLKNIRYLANLNSVPYTEEYNTNVYTLEKLLELKETSSDDIEGWVVTFEDNQMAKIKTNKYLRLHSLIGPDAFRENILIETILDGNIDDVISSLNEGTKKDYIVEVQNKVSRHFNHLVVAFKELRSKYFLEYKEDRKAFAINFKGVELFSSVMSSLRYNLDDIENVAEKNIKEYILKRTKNLSEAKEYLGKL